MKKILISYSFFLPAYKAGGPIQSMANMARQLCDSYDIYIICADVDLGDTQALADIRSDEWNNFENGTAKVNYISAQNLNASVIRRLVNEVAPDYIFVNGIYSFLFSLVPVLSKINAKKIISVRGMLHPGALSQKSLKKNIYLAFFKLLRIQQKAIFHVTDVTEGQYTKDALGSNIKVCVAENFPKQITSSNLKVKIAGQLSLVSIAIISPMKNHLLVIEALKQVKLQVVYDIYGPVKDHAYWQQCSEAIKDLPNNIVVNYKGEMQPSQLSDTLAGYDAFILPSKSENFGHAIYEGLAHGLPVITSNFTPWNKLEEQKAGINVDISNVDTITAAITQLAGADDTAFTKWRTGASALSASSISFEKIKAQYLALFN